MNAYFLTILILMTILALGFLLRPVLTGARAGQGRSVLPVVAVAVLVPVLVVGVYAFLGTPGANSDVHRPAPAPQPMGNGMPTDDKQDSVANLIGGLARRLESEPDDAGGWLLLAKSYQHLGRPEDAARAYEHASALGKTDATVEAYLAGEDTGTRETQASSIKGRVEISEDAVAGIDGSSTVFVIARNANGSPMPLAVLRTTVSALPFEFTLHDGLALVEGNNLSSAENVIVTAKISETGDALSTLDGFETQSAPIEIDHPEFVTLALGD